MAQKKDLKTRTKASSFSGKQKKDGNMASFLGTFFVPMSRTITTTTVLLHQSSTLLLYRAQKQLKLFFIIYLFFTSIVIIKAGIKSQPPQQPT